MFCVAIFQCIEKDGRPKGISCLPKSVSQGHSDILILVGKKEPSDSAFLSSSNTTTMKSVLKMFSIKRGKYVFNVFRMLEVIMATV